jgi:hypothetical protein
MNGDWVWICTQSADPFPVPVPPHPRSVPCPRSPPPQIRSLAGPPQPRRSRISPVPPSRTVLPDDSSNPLLRSARAQAPPDVLSCPTKLSESLMGCASKQGEQSLQSDKTRCRGWSAGAAQRLQKPPPLPRPPAFCLFYLSAYNARTPHLAMRSLANPHPLSALSSLISHDSCTPTSPCAHSPHPSFATGRGRPDSSTLRLLDSAACTFPSSPRALSDSFRLSSAQPTTSSVSSSHLPPQLGVSSRKYRARPVLFHCLPGRGRFDSSPLRPPSGARVPPPSHWHHVHGRGYTPL